MITRIIRTENTVKGIPLSMPVAVVVVAIDDDGYDYAKNDGDQDDGEETEICKNEDQQGVYDGDDEAEVDADFFHLCVDLLNLP